MTMLYVLAALAVIGVIITGIEKLVSKAPSVPPRSPQVQILPGSAPLENHASPPAKSTPKPAGRASAAAEDAGLRLLALQSRGHIRLAVAEPSTFIEVEPKSWAAMTHQDKEKMCRLAKTYITGLNQQGRKIDFIFFKDMTSRATLAEVCLKDGHISINK